MSWCASPGWATPRCSVPRTTPCASGSAPDKLAQYDLTPNDVAAAIREQNAQFAAGSLGAEPSPPGQAFTFTVTTRGQLSEAAQFEAIILRAEEDGSTLRLGDVARAELGAQSYAFSATYNGQNAVPMGVYLQPGANALETAQAVHEALEEMSTRFPEGLTYTVPYDTTEFVEISIREVFITLLIAVALVVLVTFLFLQHWRATLIPVAAIPVSLIGTFAGMLAFGFSVNLLTLFGLVLAIGIVVDNAIIVLENVDRLIHEKGMKAREASIETMKQVAGAVVASTLVLVAVFAPVTFLGGLTGELYRQFAVTIAVSVVVSGVVALTLTPAMCALLLDKQSHRVAKPFQWFNAGFDRLTAGFSWLVGKLLRHALIGVVLFVGVIAATLFAMSRLPPGLVPQEDQGVALVMYQLPQVSALPRTEAVRDQVSEMLLEMDEVDEFTSFAGFDLIAGALRTNVGVGFANLADWSERTAPGQDAQSLTGRIMGMGGAIPEAFVIAFAPPPIMGLSLTGGVEGYLQVRGDASTQQIAELAGGLAAAANQRPELANARTTLDTSMPRYRAEGGPREGPRHGGADQRGVRQHAEHLRVDVCERLHPGGAQLAGEPAVGGRIPQQARGSQQGLRALRQRRDDPAQLAGDPDPRSRGGHPQPLQRLLGGQVPGRCGAGLYHGPGQGGHGSGRRRGAGGRQCDAGLDRRGLPARCRGRRRRAGLRPGPADGVPDPGGPVRALVAAAGGGHGGALRGAGGGARRLAARLPQRHLLPGGPAGADRPGGQERHSDRRVRRPEPPRRDELQRGGPGRGGQRFRAILMTALTFIIGTLPLVFATGAGANSRQEIGTVVVGGMILASSLALIFVPLAYKLLEDLATWRRERQAAKYQKESTHA
jgi:preprotein translocase subunit SecF